MLEHYVERYWRQATQQDFFASKELKARFRDSAVDKWFGPDRLVSIHKGEKIWGASNNCKYVEAEVYDVPEVGKFCRLVDPDREEKLITDEAWNSISQRWERSRATTTFDKNVFYRRHAVRTLFNGVGTYYCRPLAAEEVVFADDVSMIDRGVRVAVKNDVGRSQGNCVLQYYRLTSGAVRNFRPLSSWEVISSSDFKCVEDETEFAYAAVGMLQSNVTDQYYREVDDVLGQQAVEASEVEFMEAKFRPLRWEDLQAWAKRMVKLRDADEAFSLSNWKLSKMGLTINGYSPEWLLRNAINLDSTIENCPVGVKIHKGEQG